jgi:hypothetical protein
MNPFIQLTGLVIKPYYLPRRVAMQLTLGVTEAKNRLTGLLRQAEDGEEILITRDN